MPPTLKALGSFMEEMFDHSADDCSLEIHPAVESWIMNHPYNNIDTIWIYENAEMTMSAS